MFLSSSSVTGNFSKKDFPMRILPTIGRIMDVSSTIFQPMKNRRRLVAAICDMDFDIRSWVFSE